MQKILHAGLAAFSLLAMSGGSALADFDQDVTPDAIFGSGNANGGFTTDRNKGVEIGLRGKLRFNAACAPENTFNSNGDGTYSFDAVDRTSCQTSPFPTGEWGFEWAVNTDFEDTSGKTLDGFRYVLKLDGDPSLKTNYVKWDPINLGPNGCADHSIGTNLTGNGGGAEASCPADAVAYAASLAANNVAQQSWRYNFFPFLGGLNGFDPTAVGVYDIVLKAKKKGGRVVAKTKIRILVGLPAGGLPKAENQCTYGGWQDYDPLFANEAKCIKFVNRGRNKDDDDDHDDDDDDHNHY